MKLKNMMALAAAAMMAVSFTACGGSESSSVAGGSSAAGSEPSTSSEAASDSEEAIITGDPSEHTVEAIKARGKLVVTTEAGYAPFEFLDENDNVIGLDASLAQALADDLGVELDIQNIAFTSVVPEVQAGNADMAIAGLTPNADRKKSVDMSDMYYEGGQCVLILAENADKYTTKESLDGQLVATQSGALQETIREEQFSNTEPLLLPDFPQCIANLKTGECAAVLIDTISAEQYMQTVEGLAISEIPVEVDPEEGGNSVAVMKGNTDLLDWVNERIAEYKAEGLLDQWFAEAQEKAESMGI
ncbi:MAG TPA: transporter substrate-binding domain-containing protein [Candidatus Anaerofilum excrementigallinarum]|nr:transporter substrate-binding domain-containing protein [Candidatus Anaerofilum excrementigallinarum]